MEYDLLDTVTLLAGFMASLGSNAKYSLTGVALTSCADRDAPIRIDADGTWNADSKPLWNVVGVQAARIIH